MPSASSNITKPICHNPQAVQVDKVPRIDVDSGNAKPGKDTASST